jgi:hypothetical protein
MIRLFLLGIALFLAARVIGSLFKSPSKTEVKGKSEKDSLNLSEEDVIDVDYKEIKQKKQV